MRALPLTFFSCWLTLLFCFPATGSSQTDPLCRAEQATTTRLLTGFTRPRKRLRLTAEVAGRCLEMRADLGEKIAGDTVFARLDTTFTNLALQSNAIVQAQTKTALNFQGKQVARFRKLVTSQSSAQTRLEELEVQFKQTRLALQKLQVEQKRLEETIARSTLHAPTGWQVLDRQVEPGEWVQPGQVIATVGDYQHLIVPLQLRPPELKALQRRKEIPLHIIDDQLQGTGHIWQITPYFDPLIRKIKINLALDKETLEQIPVLRGGLRVEIPIQLPDPMQAFFIPESAITERYEEHWLTRENGESFRVIVLGKEKTAQPGAVPRLRVVSNKISDGDRFRCQDMGIRKQPIPVQQAKETK